MKYVRLFLLGLRAATQYRANTVGWISVGMVPTISFIVVWLTALGNRNNINGFTKGDFVIYFFFTSIFWYIIGGTFSYQMGNAIKDGELNKFLLKPLNFTINFFIREQTWKIIALIFTIPFTLFFIYLFGKDIHLRWDYLKVIDLSVSMFAGGVIFALIESLVGLSAFWFTDLWSMIETNDIFMVLFGARIAPLVLMPSYIQTIANFLPFKYVFYVPMMILLDRVDTPWVEIGDQLLFVVILFGLYLLLWRQGLRRYEGVGA